MRNSTWKKLLRTIINFEGGCKSYSTTALNHELWQSAKPFSEMPGPTQLPLIGSAWVYMPIIGKYRFDQQHLANEDKRRRYGDIYREKIGALDIVVCFRPNDLREIVKNEGAHPFRVEFSTVKTYREMRKKWYSTIGLLALQKEEWYQFRKKTQTHILSPSVVMGYIEPLQDVTRDFVKRISEIKDSNNEITDFIEELYKWTLESVALVSLDTRLGCLQSDLSAESDGKKMIESVRTQFDTIAKLEAFSGRIQYWKWLNTPTWRKCVNACDEYAKIAFKYINIAVNNMVQNKDNAQQKFTLIQSMMHKNELSIEDMMVFVSDFLMAGMETTGHSVGFLLYRLATNPDKQELLYQEITRVLPSKDDKITSESVEDLTYLRACIKESLRLNPVVGGTARHLANDAVLSGYRVPAGTLTTVPYQGMFTDARNFENPNQFVPERFIEKKLADPLSFVPFGFGARSCIGKRIAELEMICVIAEIIRNFKVEYHGEDVGIKTLLVFAPDKPLNFRFIER